LGAGSQSRPFELTSKRRRTGGAEHIVPAGVSVRDGTDVRDAWLVAGQAYYLERDWSGWVVSSPSWPTDDRVFHLVLGDLFPSELAAYDGGFVLPDIPFPIS
jgi:hypothetical protein